MDAIAHFPTGEVLGEMALIDARRRTMNTPKLPNRELMNTANAQHCGQAACRRRLVEIGRRAHRQAREAPSEFDGLSTGADEARPYGLNAYDDVLHGSSGTRY